MRLLNNACWQKQKKNDTKNKTKNNNYEDSSVKILQNLNLR